MSALVEVLRGEGSDTSDVEAKGARQGYPSDLAPTLSAFGNMPGGGVIVLGVDERERFAAVGVYDAADAQQRLAAQARRAVSPPLRVTFEHADVDGATVVAARVAELPVSAKPCEVTATRRAYLRSYDGDYPLSESERQAFIAGRGVARDDQAAVPGTTVDDLDTTLTATYVSNCRSRTQRFSGMTDEQVLRHTRVVTPAGELTVGGLYALGTYPQTHFPTLSITAHVAPQPGAAPGTRSTDIAHFDGPLPELLDQAVAWVRRNTRTTVRFGPDGHGRDEPQYPTEAVRELVANALVHRDIGPHALSDRVRIVLEHDRLVVANPGGLHGITVERLGSGTGGHARNQSLYDICKDVRTADGRRVIEGIGSGIGAILHSLRDAGMTPPSFLDAGIRFTAIVPDHALLDPDDLAWLSTLDRARGLSDTGRHVLVLMRHGEQWSNRSLRNRFPMDSTHARTLLHDLVERGLAEPVGEGRGREYRLAGTSQSPQREPARTQDNRAAVLAAITDRGRTAQQIAATTGLAIHQVRYALRQLRDVNLIDQHGGPGHHQTTYHRRA